MWVSAKPPELAIAKSPNPVGDGIATRTIARFLSFSRLHKIQGRFRWHYEANKILNKNAHFNLARSEGDQVRYQQRIADINENIRCIRCHTTLDQCTKRNRKTKTTAQQK